MRGLNYVGVSDD